MQMQEGGQFVPPAGLRTGRCTREMSRTVPPGFLGERREPACSPCRHGTDTGSARVCGSCQADSGTCILAHDGLHGRLPPNGPLRPIDGLELSYMRSSGRKDSLTSFVPWKQDISVPREGPRPVPGGRETAFLPAMGTSRPRRLCKQTGYFFATSLPRAPTSVNSSQIHGFSV